MVLVSRCAVGYDPRSRIARGKLMSDEFETARDSFDPPKSPTDAPAEEGHNDLFFYQILVPVVFRVNRNGHACS